MVSQSDIWEASDEQLMVLFKEVRNELVLRNMDKSVIPGWLTDEIPQFADLEAEMPHAFVSTKEVA